MNTTRLTSCCFTGHRSIDPEDLPILAANTRVLAEAAVERGYTRFLCGGADGYDTLCADIIIDMMKIRPQLELEIIYPYLSGRNREKLRLYSRHADAWAMSESYSKDYIMRRNRYLVDNSALCISYLKKPSGGTFYTVNYALKQGLTVVSAINNATLTREKMF